MTNSKKIILLIVALAIPLFCLIVMIVGGLGVGAYSTFASGSAIDEAEVEMQILQIAADFASTQDLEKAQTQLGALGIPNAKQYLSFMLDRYIQEGRGQDPTDVELQNLLALANALGATTPMMIASLSTATPISTPTLPPTSTSLPTATSTPAPTDIPATDTPVPTDTVVPTDTPENTSTPAPPTNTPEPTATPEPTQPAVDFVIAEQRMFSQQENGGCVGKHQIFVTVVDAAGNPLDGVTVEDTFRAVPPHVSGEKGAGKLEYDLWKNGFSLEVTKKADGAPAKSEVTAKLSSVDEDIPDEWLLAGGYCSSPADCATRKATNQLCRGHYSYSVVFKQTY
jgi:hypothetical protein